MQFSNSITIRREPPRVFAVLADPRLIPRWNPAITSARPATPGPLGRGSRIALERVSPRPASEELQVTQLAPPARLSLRGPLGPFHGDLTYRLEAVPEGTRLTNEVELEASGPLRFVAPLAAGRVRASVAENLSALRRFVESTPG
jgi:uncharacterized protein YndB with AHSA1/START domain